MDGSLQPLRALDDVLRKKFASARSPADVNIQTLSDVQQQLDAILRAYEERTLAWSDSPEAAAATFNWLATAIVEASGSALTPRSSTYSCWCQLAYATAKVCSHLLEYHMPVAAKDGFVAEALRLKLLPSLALTWGLQTSGANALNDLHPGEHMSILFRHLSKTARSDPSHPLKQQFMSSPALTNVTLECISWSAGSLQQHVQRIAAGTAGSVMVPCDAGHELPLTVLNRMAVVANLFLSHKVVSAHAGQVLPPLACALHALATLVKCTEANNCRFIPVDAPPALAAFSGLMTATTTVLKATTSVLTLTSADVQSRDLRAQPAAVLSHALQGVITLLQLLKEKGWRASGSPQVFPAGDPDDLLMECLSCLQSLMRLASSPRWVNQPGSASTSGGSSSGNNMGAAVCKALADRHGLLPLMEACVRSRSRVGGVDLNDKLLRVWALGMYADWWPMQPATAGSMLATVRKLMHRPYGSGGGWAALLTGMAAEASGAYAYHEPREDASWDQVRQCVVDGTGGSSSASGGSSSRSQLQWMIQWRAEERGAHAGRDLAAARCLAAFGRELASLMQPLAAEVKTQRRWGLLPMAMGLDRRVLERAKRDGMRATAQALAPLMPQLQAVGHAECLARLLRHATLPWPAVALRQQVQRLLRRPAKDHEAHEPPLYEQLWGLNDPAAWAIPQVALNLAQQMITFRLEYDKESYTLLHEVVNWSADLFMTLLDVLHAQRHLLRRAQQQQGGGAAGGSGSVGAGQQAQSGASAAASHTGCAAGAGSSSSSSSGGGSGGQRGEATACARSLCRWLWPLFRETPCGSAVLDQLGALACVSYMMLRALYGDRVPVDKEWRVMFLPLALVIDAAASLLHDAVKQLLDDWNDDDWDGGGDGDGDGEAGGAAAARARWKGAAAAAAAAAEDEDEGYDETKGDLKTQLTAFFEAKLAEKAAAKSGAKAAAEPAATAAAGAALLACDEDAAKKALDWVVAAQECAWGMWLPRKAAARISSSASGSRLHNLRMEVVGAATPPKLPFEGYQKTADAGVIKTARALLDLPPVLLGMARAADERCWEVGLAQLPRDMHRGCFNPACINFGRADTDADQKYLMCGGCMCAAYCSPECQRAAWKGHQHSCGHLRELMSLKKASGGPPFGPSPRGVRWEQRMGPYVELAYRSSQG